MRNKTIIGVLFILSVLLALLFYTDYKEKQRQSAKNSELQEMVAPYEKEIQDIQSELNKRSTKSNLRSTITGIVPCFAVNSVEDMQLLKDITSGHDFTPSVALDCTVSDNEISNIVDMAQENGYSIVLAGTPFDNNVLKRAVSIKAGQSDSGIIQPQMFLLRHSDDTKDNRTLLAKNGYTNLFLYSESLDSGNKDDINYLPYGFVHSSESLVNVTNSVKSVHTCMLIVFEISDLNDNTMTEYEFKDCLDIIDECVSSGSMEYIELADAFSEMEQKAEQNKSEAAENEEYIKEKKARIEELRKKIDDIYSGWDRDYQSND